MTEGAFTVTEDQTVVEVVELMQDVQIRRLPVVNAQKHLVGILSIKSKHRRRKRNRYFIGRTFRRICAGSRPPTP